MSKLIATNIKGNEFEEGKGSGGGGNGASEEGRLKSINLISKKTN